MFEELISKARALGASDVHLEAETPIVARIRGELQIVGGTLSAERLAQASQALLGAEGWALFGTRGSADMSVAIGGTRCRASLMGNHDFAVFYEPFNFNQGAETADDHRFH